MNLCAISHRSSFHASPWFLWEQINSARAPWAARRATSRGADTSSPARSQDKTLVLSAPLQGPTYCASSRITGCIITVIRGSVVSQGRSASVVQLCWHYPESNRLMHLRRSLPFSCQGLKYYFSQILRSWGGLLVMMVGCKEAFCGSLSFGHACFWRSGIRFRASVQAFSQVYLIVTSDR